MSHFSRKVSIGARCVALLSLCLAQMSASQAAPAVSASIKPLELLAAPIVQGVSQPVLVMQQDRDPHHLALRPSERLALDRAELLLWTGPMLELPLERVVRELGAGKVLTVQELDGLHLLQVDGELDPHVWLDTRNARVIANALSERLAMLDVANAQTYRNNARDFSLALDSLDAELRTLFAGLEQQEWAVYHHAFRYFERQFGLREPLALADDDNNPPGARSVQALRDRLAQGAIRCVLTEPGVNHDNLRNLLAPATPQLVSVDVLGHEGEVSPEAYAALLRKLGSALADCLTPAG